MSEINPEDLKDLDLSSNTLDYVTMTIGGQLFGVPVLLIHDVFSPSYITPVPLSGNEIAGVLNLRGRIVTAIDTRQCLGLEYRNAGDVSMAIGIEKGGESFGLIIDAIGEVLTLSGNMYEQNPANLDECWRQVSNGIYRLDDSLMVVLDVDKLLNLNQKMAA